MRIHIIFYLLFTTIILSCNSLDETSNLTEENNDNDSNNNKEECLSCINFEIITLGVGPEGEIVDEPKVPAALKISTNDSIYYEGIIGIEIRGESSQYFDKKSFGLDQMSICLLNRLGINNSFLIFTKWCNKRL